MDYFLILEWTVKSIIILLFCVTGFAYLTFYERRALARIQVRIGPNRAAPPAGGANNRILDPRDQQLLISVQG